MTLYRNVNWRLFFRLLPVLISVHHCRHHHCKQSSPLKTFRTFSFRFQCFIVRFFIALKLCHPHNTIFLLVIFKQNSDKNEKKKKKTHTSPPTISNAKWISFEKYKEEWIVLKNNNIKWNNVKHTHTRTHTLCGYAFRTPEKRAWTDTIAWLYPCVWLLLIINQS